MSTTNLNVRIDKKTKEQAEIIFKKLGINMTTAINMFLKTSIRENGIPFHLNLDVPNIVTESAIKEGIEIANDQKTRGYRNLNDLRKALDEWNMKSSLTLSLKKI